MARVVRFREDLIQILITIGLGIFVILTQSSVGVHIWDEIANVLDIILLSLERLNNILPSAVMNLGLAFLSILIPLAIAVLTDYSLKMGSKNKEGFFELDLLVIQDYILKIEQLLGCGLLTFLPFMFWDIYPGFRLVWIAFSFLGIFLIARTILKFFSWSRGNFFKFRYLYLKKPSDLEDMEVAWRSVWISKDVPPKHERIFFNIFSSKIEKTFNDEKRHRRITTILTDFKTSLDNRSALLVVFNKEVLLKFLEWNFTMRKLSLQRLQNKSEYWAHSFNFSTLLGSVVGDIGRRAIKEKNFTFSTIFIVNFQKHVESHKTERDYVKYLFRIFYEVLFEFIEVDDYGEKRYMWTVFPREWKITKGNLDDGDNLYSRISLHIFLNWTQKRFLDKRDTFDVQLDDVSRNLFPEVEPETWARILIFILTPWEPEHRVASNVAIRKNFGRAETFFISRSEDEVREKREWDIAQKVKQQYAYKLALKIFPIQFSKENLNKWVMEATNLKYEVGSMKERNRQALLKIFEGLRKLVEDSSQDNP